MEVSPDDICYPYSEDTKKIIDCAFSVANYLGHGFLEAVYQKCLEIELTSAGIPFESQKDLRIYYKGEEVIKQTLNELTEKLENELINEAKKAGFDNETSIKFKNAYFNQLEKVGYERIDICNVLHSVDNEKRKEINKLSELYYKKAKQVNWI